METANANQSMKSVQVGRVVMRKREYPDIYEIDRTFDA